MNFWANWQHKRGLQHKAVIVVMKPKYQQMLLMIGQMISFVGHIEMLKRTGIMCWNIWPITQKQKLKALTSQRQLA